MSNETALRVDRRTTLRWLAAAIATEGLLAGCGDNRQEPAIERFVDLGIAAPPDSSGYGTDPDLMAPVVPWRKTMTEAQLRVAAALADAILPANDTSPAASAVGVQHFIDEWVSAPYEAQLADRPVILDGLAWLENEARSLFDTSFATAGGEQVASILDRVAYRERVAPGMGDRARFFDTFRHLAMSAYYSTQAGIEEIGYIGNKAIAGKYPGPSDAALKHLHQALERLGLT